MVKSERFNIPCGTAQGSYLDPLLFILFVNDIHLLPLYSTPILFTDDTTIFNSNKSSRYLQYMIENDLNHMVNWFSANKLSLNLSKTVAMKFWSDNEDRNFQFRIKGQIVPIVPNTKFLGVYIDNMLTWNAHTNYVIEKLQNNRRMISLGKHLLDPTCLRNIYYGHIHSHLSYGLAAWDSMASASQEKELKKLPI